MGHNSPNPWRRKRKVWYNSPSVNMKKMALGVMMGLLLNLGGIFLPNSLAGISPASAEENVYLDDEIEFHFTHEKNMHHFTMLSGKLVDLAREQGRIFMMKNGSAENGVILKAQEYLNDANAFASRDDYEDAYVRLRSAYDLLKTSMDELGVKKSNVVPSASNWKILK